MRSENKEIKRKTGEEWEWTDERQQGKKEKEGQHKEKH